jgi:hypothetical protein
LFREGPDTEKQDIALGEQFGVGEMVKSAWAYARVIADDWSGAPELMPEEDQKSFTLFSEITLMEFGDGSDQNQSRNQRRRKLLFLGWSRS